MSAARAAEAVRAQLVGLVRELAPELGVPVVHVTHSIAEARLLADRVIQLDAGKVIAEGKPDDVLDLSALE